MLAGLFRLTNASSGSPSQSVKAPSGVYPSGYCALCARSLDYFLLQTRLRVLLPPTFSRAITRIPLVNALFSSFSFFSFVYFFIHALSTNSSRVGERSRTRSDKLPKRYLTDAASIRSLRSLSYT
eukprot:IDg8403t1